MSRAKLEMLVPEIRSLFCVELEQGRLPSDPEHCALYIYAQIGIRGQEAADTFGFTAITPSAISGSHERRWGRGYIVLPRFSWEAVRSELEKVLVQCSGPSWTSIEAELKKHLL
jgi:hypothetical protein